MIQHATQSFIQIQLSHAGTEEFFILEKETIGE